VTLVLLQLLGLPLMLAILYPIAIQYERGKHWRVLAPLYVTAGVLSAWLNWTTFALLFRDWPVRSEKTFSQRLWRLQYMGDWRGKLARGIIAYLDFFDPSPPHVKP